MAVLVDPHKLVGTFRRFGVSGPVYQIVDAVRPLPADDYLMRVRLPLSGEEMDYKVSKILEDPREA
jgi:hypothetical protein